MSSTMLVYIEDRKGNFVVSSADSGQYGWGASRSEAIGDFCEVVSEYYGMLRDEEGRLGKTLVRHLAYLRLLLGDRDSAAQIMDLIEVKE